MCASSGCLTCCGSLLHALASPFAPQVGISKTDFQQLHLSGKLAAAGSMFIGTGSDLGMAPRRLSYVLGTHGLASAIHTACSSALVALDFANSYSGAGEEWSVSGVHMVLIPPLWAAYSGGMHSLNGRSCVFDQRADGFARSEACASMALLLQQTTISLQGSAARQDGKSASLTAPNGQAQRIMLRAAINNSGISHTVLVEAAANGSPLGDPVEVAALASVLSSSPIMISNAKGSIAHSEPSSGASGVATLGVKLLQQLGSANAQMRIMNRVIGDAKLASSHLFLTQHALAWSPAYSPTAQSGGVSAFGYTGTIAHAMLSVISRHTGAMPARVFKKVLFQQQYVLWRKVPNPFVLTHVASSHEVLFILPIVGKLHSLFSDHVLYGQNIFPAVGYLEMVRAAYSAKVNPTNVKLSGVYFLQPLVVEGSHLHVECKLAGGRFDVSSGQHNIMLDRLLDGMLHSSGSFSSVEESTTMYGVNRAQVRFACPICVSAADLYPSGRDFGPGYRWLSQAWNNSQMAASRLRARTNLHGTGVHPADLDAAIGLKVILLGAAVGIPFAMEDARLDGDVPQQRYHMWAVRCMNLL